MADYLFVRGALMSKIRLEKIDVYLQERLKNKAFRKLYEVERTKVALAQKIAQMRQKKHLNQRDLAAPH